jgi:xylulokinase
MRAVGNAVLPGFTASKILWLKKNEPKNYRRLATVLLPHDYLNYWLTGQKVMEFGDASGTALLDVRRRKWSEAIINAIDPGLSTKLPPLISSDKPAGHLRASTAKALGLSADVLVSAGGGDNMMGAIGTGNTRPGVITASFGTSGTIYACSDKPVIDTQGEIAAFCDSTNRWLPLLCTMNVTVATEMVRRDFHWTVTQFDAAVESASRCRASLLPYLEGERTPNVPAGTGVFLESHRRPLLPISCAGRGGRCYPGMNYGLRRLRELGVKPKQIRYRRWSEIEGLAADYGDIFNTEVVTVKVSEGAAYGAALQALWCWRRDQGENIPITEITDEFVELNRSENAQPIRPNVAIYQELQTLQDEMSASLRPLFLKHRQFLSR